jgi:histidine triad (HIT) family protein
MTSHAPKGWDCPFCRIAQGEEGERPWTKHTDVVYRDSELIAFVSAHWFSNNPGHVLVVPCEHHENVYDMPDELLGKVAVLSKRLALAMKRAYECDGTSTRQHNEPAGGQDVWHYHLHVFPRFKGDDLYRSSARLTVPEERKPFADRLRMALDGDL